jgi:hypothetical protein
MKCELVRIWKETVVDYFKALPLHFFEGNTESYKKSHKSRYSNLTPLNMRQNANNSAETSFILP